MLLPQEGSYSNVVASGDLQFSYREGEANNGKSNNSALYSISANPTPSAPRTQLSLKNYSIQL